MLQKISVFSRFHQTLGSLQGRRANGNTHFEAGEQRERLLTAENS